MGVDKIEDGAIERHEEIVYFSDTATGLAGVVAIHSTALGPAAGGCRMTHYVDREAAVTDVLRLSRGMSYKNAVADLPAGGGKAVIYQVDPAADRGAVFEAFGRSVEALGGRYITAEDVGTRVSDMQHVARSTRFVAGLPSRGSSAGGDPSPWTAMGVFLSLEAAIGRPLAGSRIAVQGLGAVGFELCRQLDVAGARLVVADIDKARAQAAKDLFQAEVVPVETIHQVEADVFSPNALGGVLNADVIERLAAPVVCGGANNQLASDLDGERLFRRGVVYVPDYVANAGGIINVMAEFLGETSSDVRARVLQIGQRVTRILDEARSDRRPSNEIADRIARTRIGARSKAT